MKIFFLCPVPEDQKPINEYIGLKENGLTNWTTLSYPKYLKKIFSIFFFFLFIISFFNNFSFFSFLIETLKNIFLQDFPSSSLYPSFFYNLNLFSFLEQILKNIFLSFLLLFFNFFILIFRWDQLKARFNQSRFIYEEASWYDVQIWEKPLLLIKNERLMTTQKIIPILQRLVKTIFFLFFLIIFIFLNNSF